MTASFAFHLKRPGELRLSRTELKDIVAKKIKMANNETPKLLISTTIMGAMASQITSLRIVYSTVYSGAGQRKYQS